jgi:hypothetical protein
MSRGDRSIAGNNGEADSAVLLAVAVSERVVARMALGGIPISTMERFGPKSLSSNRIG